MRPQLASDKVSVLVIVGELDEATTPVMSRELAAGLSDATFVELRGCAHVPQLQEPELFLATAAPFLVILM
jgi:3-oxoadipate enol-lactonase